MAVGFLTGGDFGSNDLFDLINRSFFRSIPRLILPQEHKPSWLIKQGIKRPLWFTRSGLFDVDRKKKVLFSH
jgi:hypothetical protein